MSFSDTMKEIEYNGYNLTHKTFWNQLNKRDEDKDIEVLVENIIESVQDDKNIQRKTLIDPRTALQFSVVKKGNVFSIWRNEEALERVITAKLTQDNYFNQYHLGNSKENIDMIQWEDNSIKKIIELKAENGSDSPLYALAELLKNYYIVKADGQFLAENLELIVLAPKEYYLHYEKSMPIFRTIVDMFELKLKNISILIQTVGISSDNILTKIAEERLIEMSKTTETEKYDELFNVSSEEVEKISQELKEKIILENYYKEL